MYKQFFTILLFAVAVSSFAQEQAKPRYALATNAAYLAINLDALNSSSPMLAFPLEGQIVINEAFALHPSILVINSVFGLRGRGILVVAECGLAWRPKETGLQDWYLSAGPGLAVSSDSLSMVAIIAIDGGYQWIFSNGLLLGLGGGIRNIFMLSDQFGFMPIPDFKIRLGWTF